MVSAAFQEKFGLTRVQVSLFIGGLAMVISLVLYSSTSGLAILDTVDKYTNEVGVVVSAIATCVIVTVGAKKLPELRAHLNAVSTGSIGRWWSVLVGAVVPIALTIMLVTSLLDLFDEPYSGYPWAFVTTVGWGIVGLMVVASLVYTLVPWRRPVDDFRPEPLPEFEEAGR